MSRETDRAWAAGFFDGEGCFHASRRYRKGNNYYANIGALINQTDPEVLERFKDIVGVGSVRGPIDRGRSPNHKPTWRYQIQSFNGVARVFNVLLPYLGSVKVEQGRQALELYLEARADREAKNEPVASK